MTYLQISALIYLFTYFGIIIGLRSYLLYKRTGINALRHVEKDGIAGIVEKVLAVGLVVIAVVVLNFVFLENNYLLLVPIPYLLHPMIGYIGIGMSLVGLIIGIVAQLQMGDAWRLGLNKTETTTLVYEGLFRFSRNPIYLSVFISNIGFFLMMPNALSFTLVVLNYVALEIKIRLEEEYLTSTHGEEYISYQNKVRRWI